MKNISFMGAVYSDVPAVTLPDAGGGVARFDDASITTATASDVLQGKYFLAADGTITEGTNSGGGGGVDINDVIEGKYAGSISDSNLTIVKNYFFSGWSSLTAVNFPAVSSIGEFAFASCASLVTASFQSAIYIRSRAFYECTSLTTISFPVATNLSSYAFANCSSLTTASFPLLTSIASYAFAGCTSLTTASFPSVTGIGGNAFMNCSSLTTVNIPEATRLGASSFRSCYSLTTVSFSKVASILTQVFAYCSKLESAYFLTDSVPSCGASVFLSTPISSSTYLGYFGSIYVKASLLDSFKTETNWAAYSARMVGLNDEEIAALG